MKLKINCNISWCERVSDFSRQVDQQSPGCEVKTLGRGWGEGNEARFILERERQRDLR